MCGIPYIPIYWATILTIWCEYGFTTLSEKKERRRMTERFNPIRQSEEKRRKIRQSEEKKKKKGEKKMK